jgi:hypothetical protein
MRLRIREIPAFGQHLAAIQLFGQHLQHYARERVALDHFPEMRRPAAVAVVVAVVERPDAVARRLQNVSSQDVEAEAQQHVQIFCAHRGHGLLGKAMREALGDRRDA